MTVEQVEELVRAQVGDNWNYMNDHRISLKQALVSPQKMPVIVRAVRNDRVKDELQEVWLIGQEESSDGYRIVMREDGLQFGLASKGFPTDKHLVLTGWYGGLKSAFLSM